MSRVHQVPMCRQRIDPGEWDAHGGAALGDRAEWSDRACGMAALRMILLAYRRPAPPLTELVALGVREGALTDRGWLHAGIASLAHRFGLPARAQAVAAAPVIVSVTEKFPDDGRKGGHLVVARGYHDTPSGDPDILFRDPSGWGQTCDRVPLSRLAAYGWQQDARVRQAQQLGDIAAELHERFGTLMQHLHKTGRSLNTAVKTYNALATSLENRVLPQMRRLEELGVLVPGAHLPDVQIIEAQTQAIPFPDELISGESLDHENGTQKGLEQLGQG